MTQFTVRFAGDANDPKALGKFKDALVRAVGQSPVSNIEDTEHTFRVHTAPEILHLKNVITQTIDHAEFVEPVEAVPEPENAPAVTEEHES